MCGICGFVSMRGLPENSGEVLKKMTKIMAHRGPDDTGYYRDKHIALGFRRLSIIDLETGRQPITDENNRLILVFNGEIYNFQQLRRELQARGHRFRTQTDSEVIVHLYEDLGEDCVNRLRGMFAFALWDTVNRRLLLARDRFGIKPLYYARAGDLLLFASEAKSLLQHPDVTPRLNLDALPHYLTFQYFPDPETGFRDIFRLNPAHYLTFTAEGTRLQQYWQLRFKPVDKPLDYFVDKAEQLLQESVRLHMVSDVARGAFLSSGVDSSTIVALFNRLEPVQTFAVGCAGGKYDELPQARETAGYLGTRHREVQVGAREFWDNLPRIVWYQDEPVADPAAIALYFVARLAAEEVKVVLSGEGADEVFGGYDIYREPRAVAPLQRAPQMIKKALHGVSRRLPDGFKGKSYLYRGTTPLERRYFGNACIFSEEEKHSLLNKELLPAWDPPWQVTEGYHRRSRYYDESTRMQYLDFHTWLPGDILAKADRMTMAHSLELRVPFLDHPLVEFAATIPAQYKIRRRMTKYVLRRAAARYLPPEVSKRPKLGFPVPIAHWIRDHYFSHMQELFESPIARTFFNVPKLQEMLNMHCRQQADYGRKLWTITIFLLWHQTYLGS